MKYLFLNLIFICSTYGCIFDYDIPMSNGGATRVFPVSSISATASDFNGGLSIEFQIPKTVETFGNIIRAQLNNEEGSIQFQINVNDEQKPINYKCTLNIYLVENLELTLMGDLFLSRSEASCGSYVVKSIRIRDLISQAPNK